MMADNTKTLQFIEAQANLFGKALILLKELGKEVEDLKERVLALEPKETLANNDMEVDISRPPGCNEPDAEPNSLPKNQQKTISKTPAQDRLKRLRK